MPISKEELFLSIDVEADGPIPGANSLLSYGVYAFKCDGTGLGMFYSNLELLPGAVEDPETMLWWNKQGDAYDETRLELETPLMSFRRFEEFVTELGHDYVLSPIAYPAAYDYMWIQWYSHKFLSRSLLGIACLDIKTLAWTKLGGKYRETSKRNFPKDWLKTNAKHSHNALDDAKEQAEIFLNILNYQ